ncbi:hypothetical protein Deba_0166 [Desulfarculus baarsii DSM 2075]|uniref:Uncharacterized protein n=1 Tax=Desulfarculus baarsii (strain ATCC 33931 / DSM 2075 / LMG 7858 / VKM B-1802 / 2st14) TaxID=644282 RepID=E1QDM6_DESB2|nr:hypothetical protein [Desulfarculus baarsii]ADK83545.1 hypothetical protein Deba_0166 [Desulfarculus baarsii DSM 2075]
MIKVPVDKLSDGQVLAQDVVRDDGVVLMTKGRQITAEVINLLGRLQVEAVVVEGDAFASDEERQAYQQLMEQALDHRFSRVADDPVLKAIRELLRAKLRAGCVFGGPKPGAPTIDDSGKLLKKTGRPDGGA